MADDHSSAGSLLALLALGVCCGLPFLLAAGVAASAVGLAFGGSAAILAAIVLAPWLVRRRRNRCRSVAAREAPR